MRITINRQLFSFLFMVSIGMFFLTACGTSDEPTPVRTPLSALDIDRLNVEADSTATAQAAAVNVQLTQTFAPTPLPTNTLLPERPSLPEGTRITLTPVPTIEVELNEDDILGNIVAEQAWLSQPFEATDGNEYRMQSFEGSVIMVQLMDQRCDTCLNQLLNTRVIAQKFVDEERGYDIVYIILNTNLSTSITGLLNWSRSQGVDPSTDLNWYIGNPSQDLLDSIAATFGEENVDPQNAPVLIIDMDGFTHIGESGVMSENRIRDVLIYYADPPVQEEGTVGD